MITKVKFMDRGFEVTLTKEDIEQITSRIEVQTITKNYFVIKKNNKVYEIIIDNESNNNLFLWHRGNIFSINISKIFHANNNNVSSTQPNQIHIKSPMPGLISKIKVRNGEMIKKGDSLITIEAMKMENEIKAPLNGIIESIKVSIGSIVEKNEVLIVLKAQY